MLETLPGLDLFWRNALLAVPVALLAAALCRLSPQRPATRHALWLIVLLAFLMPPIFAPPLPGDVARAAPEPAPLPADAVPAPPSPATPPRETTPPRAPAVPPTAEPRPQAPSAPPVITRTARTTGSSWNAPAAVRSTARPVRALPSRSTSFTYASGRGPTASLPALAAFEPPGPMPSTTRGARRTAPLPPPRQYQAVGERLEQSPFRLPPAVPTADERSAPLETSGVATTPPPTPPAPPALPAPPARIAEPEPPRAPAAASPALLPSTPAATAATGTNVLGAAAALAEGVLADGRRWVADARGAIGAIPPMPTVIWILGALGIGSVFGVRAWRSARVLRRSEPAPPRVERLVRETADRLGVRRSPPVRMVDDAYSPMVFCGRRPVLVIPRSLWSGLDDAGRVAVLLHELAHLKRRDHWVCRVAFLACIAYWWHPVAWWMRRRLEEEADLCCDAWVTSTLPHVRRAYAQALLDTKSYVNKALPCPAPALRLGVTSVGAKRFARRLTMVLTKRSRPRISIRGAALVASLAFAAWLVAPIGACPPDKEKKSEAKAPPATAPSRITARSLPSRPIAPKPPRAPKAPKPPKAPKAPKAPAAPMAPMAPAAPALPGADAAPLPEAPTTFERYMRERGGDSVEDRLEALEGVLEDLHRKLQHFEQAPAPEPPQVSLDLLRRRLPGLVVTGRSDPSCKPRRATPRCTPSRHGVTSSRAIQLYTLGRAAPQAYSDAAQAYVVAIGTPGPQENVVRRYELSPGKLEALTELMIREDVPVLVRPLDDGIEVHAPEPHQMIFQAFITMIDREDDERSYELSRGKLEALAELMIREDVPVLVSPGDDDITVFGDTLEQLIFEAFVKMIEGEGSPAAAPEVEVGEIFEFRGAPPAPATRPRGFERRAQEELKQLSRQHGRVRVQIRKQFADQIGAQRRQMSVQRREIERQRNTMEREMTHLERQLERIEEQMDKVEDRADDARDEADDVRDRLEDAGGRNRDRMEAKVAELEAMAQALEQEAEAMARESEMLEGHMEGMEDQHDAIEDQVELIEESVEDAIESLEDELEALLEQLEDEMEMVEEQLEDELEALEDELEDDEGDDDDDDDDDEDDEDDEHRHHRHDGDGKTASASSAR